MQEEDPAIEPTVATATPEHGEPAEVAFVCPATVVDSVDTDDSAVVSPSPSILPLADAITGLGETLGRRLDAMQAAFDREVRAESTREKVVDRLHAELQGYKNDLHLSLLRPVFIDLIQLHDDIGKVTSAQSDLDASATRLIGLMEGFRQGIEDILYRQGVEAFEAEGATFDPRCQRAFSTRPTIDPSLNKQIAARLRKGFRAAEKIIRPEIVSVFAFKPDDAGTVPVPAQQQQ